MSEANPLESLAVAVASKTIGNPEGKGANGFVADLYLSEPRDVVAKPAGQLLAELFTSMLVLSATFKFRPVVGAPYYLYWRDGAWSLSLIAPGEWSREKRAGFAGRCVLQRDMTWTISPSSLLVEKNAVSDAVRRFYKRFAQMLNTDRALEEILPFFVGQIPYYQRLFANALSRSVRAAISLSGQSATSCRQWYMLVPQLENVLPSHRS